jgi:ubiquinone/menaquinone biosynthesis C-methylase UbiE
VIRKLIGGVALALVVVTYWLRKHPSACPYSQRFWVELPHPLVTRGRLHEILAPQPGQRVLEIGPGTGYYTLDLAERVQPDGEVEIFDLQQEMLDHTMERARERGISNVRATQGDAQSLPYEDDSFDAAVLISTLGEIPDQDAALRETKRVLKPDGRLVVGEVAVDPHVVTLGTLRPRAEAAGLTYEMHVGPKLGYFARLRA